MKTEVAILLVGIGLAAAVWGILGDDQRRLPRRAAILGGVAVTLLVVWLV